MDTLPAEVLQLVTIFGVPTGPDKASPPSGNAVRSSMRWVATLRLVNRRWKDSLDGQDCHVWYHVAQALGLGPPKQLYAGGTYLDVCKLLLAAEEQKMRATAEALQRPRYWRTGCKMRMPEKKPRHPHPERPRVELPTELVERVAENARALESFLGSVNFSVLTSPGAQGWHESALNRYRMFLHLKRTYPSLWLIPTADIEFCWLAHIFRTEAYWNDMNALDISSEHSLCLTSYGEVATFTEAVRATASLWKETYGDGFPYLSPDTDINWRIWQVKGCEVSRSDPRRFVPAMGQSIANPPSMNLPTISLTADEIKADLEWFPGLQDAFEDMRQNSYDVMRGRDSVQLITQQVLPSYERFLNLCNKDSMDNPAPPFVLDLIWHAHQMEPVRYKQDCLSLFGREFWHHPWPNGLGVTSKVSQEFQCKWKQAFGTTMADDWKYYLGDDE